MDRRNPNFMVANRSFLRKNARLLYILAGVLLVLWFLPSRTVITSEEEDLWNRVRSAQDYMYEWRSSNGVESDREHDPWKTGLIGIEWSPVTTTLGSLESKRTACDPRWSIVTSRWFEGLGLSEGDPVAIFSSGSFPGLLLNALCAAEDRGLDIFLVVSLGSSTWGANLPGLLWSDMGDLLRNAGFISTVASFYTPGGGAETGRGLSPEGLEIIRKAAENRKVEMILTGSLEEMIETKVDLLEEKKVRVLVNIGGSASSLGTDEEILKLQGGLLMPSDGSSAGNGVIAGALERDIPVIHFLDLKGLCLKTGVPYDSKPGRTISRWKFPFFSLAGIVIFLVVVAKYRRWEKIKL